MAYVLRAESAFRQLTELFRKPFELLPFERPDRAANSDVSPVALASMIEGEIIPRLLLAHQLAPRALPGGGGRAGITPDDVTRFAHMVVVEDLEDLLAHVDGLLDRGVAVEQIYFDLLSPAARLLGFMWEEDTCSFADVTVGLCRLQQVVYDLSDREPPLEEPAERRNALFTLTPGDQHAFGLLLVGEFFRRAGWRTVSAPNAGEDELIDLVSSEPFDLLCLSVSDEQWLGALPDLIATLRRASCNPLLRVMVGGKLFSEQPALFAQVGADATAEDARLAVRTAERLVDQPFHVA